MSEIVFPPTDTPGFHVNPASALPRRSRVQTYPAGGQTYNPADTSLAQSRASVSSEWTTWDSDMSASMSSSVGPSGSVYGGSSTAGYRTPMPSQSVIRSEGPSKIPMSSSSRIIRAEPPRIRREEVWKEMLATSNGRDKAFVRSFCSPQLQLIT